MPRVSGLSGLFNERLPLNRKERYYTGTVLPMIVASDGFKHFGRFLDLCGMSEVALEADPNSTNVQFFSEYGFKESLMDGAKERFDTPSGDTPDLIVYVESEQSLLLGVEAKVFDRPSIADVRKQLGKQAQVLSIMANGVKTQPSVQQVALLPAGLWDPMPERINDDVPVLTWQQVACHFHEVAPRYWISVLNEALCRYDRLAAQSGSGRQNCDEMIRGLDIVDSYRSNEFPYGWIGRSGGLSGPELQQDIRTGEWKSRKYEVRYSPLHGNRNWFSVKEFIEKIERKRIGTQLTAVIEREGDGYVALCPQLDIASQGDTVALARKNLKEALELFFETAGSEEISRRLRGEVYVTQVEVSAAG